MSTPVVGSCGDCIVSVPNVPPTSLRFKVVASEGNNAILRQLGTVTGYYPSETIQTVARTLAPGDTFSQTTEVGALCINTTAPLQIALTKGVTVTTITINQVLLLDQDYDSFVITNLMSSLLTAKVSIVFVGAVEAQP